MNDALAALSALAQETRLAAFRQLVQAGPEGMAAGALGAALDVRANTLSAHLAQLHAAGLVTSRRKGRLILYAAEIARMRALLDFLTEDCCGGRPELCRAPAVTSEQRG